MEEILASIRRILADGQGLWNGSQEFCAEREASEPGAYSARPGAVPDALRRNGHAACPPGEPYFPRNQASSDKRLILGSGRAALASAATEGSVAASLQALVAGRFAQSTDLVMDLTREMIRPLLEAWLDAHLPALVERLVAAEIARISRGE